MTADPRPALRELEFQQLRIIDALLREGSQTRAAAGLDMTQPALSKTLARLRVYFGDPLFVRVGSRMEPTPRAQALAAPIGAILAGLRELQHGEPDFDPLSSDRKFSLYMIDGAIVYLLPALLAYLRKAAPRVRVQAVQCDVRHLDLWLESGLVDFALGPFPDLVSNIRRLPLWTESYVTIVRDGHPRIGADPDLSAFTAEQHALVSVAGTGHHYGATERALESVVAPQNVVCRVPSFTAAAHIVRHSDALATLPKKLAYRLAADLGLRTVATPVELPLMDIGQHWHERYHRDPGNRWMRGVLRALFAD